MANVTECYKKQTKKKERLTERQIHFELEIIAEGQGRAPSSGSCPEGET